MLKFYLILSKDSRVVFLINNLSIIHLLKILQGAAEEFEEHNSLA